MASLPKGAKPLVPGDEAVEVKHGPDAVLLRMRDRENEHFVFASFGDNPAYHNMQHEDWQHLAKGAIDRFMAIKGLNSTGVFTSSTSPYDFMASWT